MTPSANPTAHGEALVAAVTSLTPASAADIRTALHMATKPAGTDGHDGPLPSKSTAAPDKFGHHAPWPLHHRRDRLLECLLPHHVVSHTLCADITTKWLPCADWALDTKPWHRGPFDGRCMACHSALTVATAVDAALAIVCGGHTVTALELYGTFAVAAMTKVLKAAGITLGEAFPSLTSLSLSCVGFSPDVMGGGTTQELLTKLGAASVDPTDDSKGETADATLFEMAYVESVTSLLFPAHGRHSGEGDGQHRVSVATAQLRGVRCSAAAYAALFAVLRRSPALGALSVDRWGLDRNDDVETVLLPLCDDACVDAAFLPILQRVDRRLQGSGPSSPPPAPLRSLSVTGGPRVTLRLPLLPTLTDVAVDRYNNRSVPAIDRAAEVGTKEDGVGPARGLFFSDFPDADVPRLQRYAVDRNGVPTVMRRLDISLCDTPVSSLGPALAAHAPTLTALDIGNVTPFSGDVAVAFATRASSLLELEMQGTGPNSTDIEPITAALGTVKPPTLRRLNLDGMSITPAALSHLPDTLTSLSLDLDVMADGAGSLDVVTPVHRLKRLEDLEISGQLVSADSLAGLGRLPVLRELIMWDCTSLTDDIIAAAMGPGTFPVLRRLTVSQQQTITGATLAVLLRIPTLESLNVWGCGGLQDSDFAALSGSRLTALDVNETKFASTGVSALGHMPWLVDLDVGECPDLTDTDICGLVAAVPQVRDLSLKKTNVAGAGLRAVTTLSDLTHLNLEDCPSLSDHDLAALSDPGALPSLQELTVPPCTGAIGIAAIAGLSVTVVDATEATIDGALFRPLLQCPRLHSLAVARVRHSQGSVPVGHPMRTE